MKPSVFFTSIILFFFNYSFSQSDAFLFDKDLLSRDFHASRREALRMLLPPNSLAIFFANPIRKRSNDIDFQYSQDPNFYYLTGLREPNAMLLLFKENQEIGNASTNTLLFIQPKNTKAEAWTGRRLGVIGAKATLGIEQVYENTVFGDLEIDLSKYDKVFHLPLEMLNDDKEDKGDLASLIQYLKFKISKSNASVDTFQLGQWMAALRSVKQAEELQLLNKAIAISCKAHTELIKAIQPDMMEYQIQGIVEYFFREGGAEYEGYPSIVGGGENGCILHYNTNRKKLKPRDLVVVDAGAEYHGYTADITRTLPVDGTFSKQEKTIYNIVLEAQLAGIAVCKKGNDFRAAHNAAVDVIKQRLLEYEIIKKPEEYLNYFFHGTSHYLGLDVHDAGLYGKLEPGNVITVEPGIYIPIGSDCDIEWWNIGVRIEDDILITDGEPKVLSNTVPKTVEEIETLMKEESFLNKK